MSITAHQVLSSLFNAEDTVCLRVFADRKDDVYTGSKLNVECGKFASMEETLKKHNEQNRGIFYVVNDGVTSLDRETLVTLIDRIVIHPTGDFEITWNFEKGFRTETSRYRKGAKSL